MPVDDKHEARTEVREAQAEFERADAQRDKAGVARRRSFERAQKAGLTQRDIADEVGLHHTRVGQIIRGD
ncbi:MAG TPA: hypothetical protein VFW48_10565 [Solirubrobacterales bacterium]|nr:hypothetical protein [Solirubrobacterales bacterium]